MIRKRFKEIYGLKIQKQQFYNMLRNNVYCGEIRIPEYKKEATCIVKGLHEPLISKELFETVQDVLYGRKKLNAKLPTTINPEFPLKGSLICSVCGKKVTGSKSKGNGGHYHYYHCTSKCKIRVKKAELHNQVVSLLGGISLNANVKELFKEVMRDLIKDNEQQVQLRRTELLNEQESLNKLILEAEDRLMNREIDMDLFSRITSRYKAKIEDADKELSRLKSNGKQLVKYVDGAVEILCNIDNCFNQLEDSKKGSFLRTIFPENIVIEKGGFRTTSTNTILELLSRNFKDLEEAKIKKAAKISGFSNEAPPLGLEPRTL